MRSVVQLYPDPPNEGAIAQLGEHLLCKQEVGGSIPPGSTTRLKKGTDFFPPHSAEKRGQIYFPFGSGKSFDTKKGKIDLSPFFCSLTIWKVVILGAEMDPRGSMLGCCIRK